MKRILVYSHDTYGLGNIRRMLSICTYLIKQCQDLSILIISSSPMIHTFKIPPRIDYLKLPSLHRAEEEGYTVKFLSIGIDETMRLRSELIRSSVVSYKPDLVLVDKKPLGIKSELEDALSYIKACLPKTKLVLLLRDILDKPEATIKIWKKNKFHEAILNYYNQVQVVGTAEVFDVRKEYQYPPPVSEMTRFCGYIAREPGRTDRETLRKKLRIGEHKLVLVTPGGGADGYRLLDTYIKGLDAIPKGVKSLVITGPEMPEAQRDHLRMAMIKYPSLKVTEFTDDMMAHMDAADVVVSMGGYNTICEILSLKKRAIVVPRTKPVQEQWIRAERMAKIGLFKVIHPDDLTPECLMTMLSDELKKRENIPAAPPLDMDGLPRIKKEIFGLLRNPQRTNPATHFLI